MSLAMKSAMPSRVVGVRKVSVRRAPRASRIVRAAGTPYSPSEENLGNPLVPVLSFLGWTIPANIPVGAFGGKSLFGLFLERIGDNLAHFPQGPSQDDPFWLYFTLYHFGLIITLVLGQVGANAKKQGYLP